MGDPGAGALRAARTLALAAVVVALAATAHVLGGGELPPALLMTGVLVVTTALVGATTARRHTRTGALAVLGAGQVALHSAFVVLAPGEGPSAGTAALLSAAHGGGHPQHPATTAAHHLHGVLAGSGARGGALGGPDQDLDLLGAGASMLLAHAAATVVTALLVASADRSLWLLLAWLAPLVGLLGLVVLVVAPRLRRVPAPVRLGAPRRLLLARSTSRRGPPRGLTALA